MINNNLAMFGNMCANLPGAINGHDLSVLTDQFKGVPCLILSAGPSLNQNLADVDIMRRAIQGKMLIICVDAALRVVRDSGWEPHIVVTCDPSECTSSYLAAIADSYLIRDVSANPKLGDARTLTISTSCTRLKPIYESTGRIPGNYWGSVSSMALHIARELATSPVFFMGQDLAYHDTHTHAAGSPANKDSCLHLANAHVELGADGCECMVPQDFFLYRNFLHDQFMDMGRFGKLAVNLTGRGVLTGLEQRKASHLNGIISSFQSQGLWRRLENLTIQKPHEVNRQQMMGRLADLCVGGSNAKEYNQIVNYVSEGLGGDKWKAQNVIYKSLFDLVQAI